MIMPYTLKDLVLYFLKLGTTGFGGPVALVGYMHKDLVEKRNWISEEEYKQGLALAQLAPGPLAAQLGIYLGFVHYGVLGATLTGLAFVLPSFFMVLGLGWLYVHFEGLAWLQSAFYGVGAAVIGIIALSTYKLTIKSVSKFDWTSFKTNWLLWIFFALAAFITFWTQQEPVWLFIGCGLLYMLIKTRPNLGATSYTFLNLLWSPWSIQATEWNTLSQIALYFAKAGAFVFGSGLAIVPFLHAGVVKEFGWLTEQQFLDAIAVAMITPGPVVITVGFIGYLIAGFKGACVAALATFLPCYFFTILPAPYFKKIAQNKYIKTFVEGITASVIGALLGAVIVIASRSIVDFSTAFIAMLALLSLIYIKKLQEPYLILIGAAIGLLINYFH